MALIRLARNLSSLAWLVLWSASFAQAAYPPAAQSGAQPYHAAVVRIFASFGDGRISGSTGVLVAKQGHQGLLLTAAHNVADGGPYHVQWPSGQGGSFVVLAQEETLDLAALQVVVPEGVEPIPLAAKLPLGGSKVELAGYSGNRWELTYPTIRGYHKHRRVETTDLGLSSITTNGESGAPVLSFEQGQPRVAGIVWGGRPAYADNSMEFGQATDALWCRWFIDKTPALAAWRAGGFLQISTKGSR